MSWCRGSIPIGSSDLQCKFKKKKNSAWKNYTRVRQGNPLPHNTVHNPALEALPAWPWCVFTLGNHLLHLSLCIHVAFLSECIDNNLAQSDNDAGQTASTDVQLSCTSSTYSSYLAATINLACLWMKKCQAWQLHANNGHLQTHGRAYHEDFNGAKGGVL